MNKDEWPKIIRGRAPEKYEFKVFDSLDSGGAYKILTNGQKYNDHMYQKALKEYKKHGYWMKYSDWFELEQ
jgi:hypothetical protein